MAAKTLLRDPRCFRLRRNKSLKDMGIEWWDAGEDMGVNSVSSRKGLAGSFWKVPWTLRMFWVDSGPLFDPCWTFSRPCWSKHVAFCYPFTSKHIRDKSRKGICVQMFPNMWGKLYHVVRRPIWYTYMRFRRGWVDADIICSHIVWGLLNSARNHIRPSLLDFLLSDPDGLSAMAVIIDGPLRTTTTSTDNWQRHWQQRKINKRKTPIWESELGHKEILNKAGGHINEKSSNANTQIKPGTTRKHNELGYKDKQGKETRTNKRNSDPSTQNKLGNRTQKRTRIAQWKSYENDIWVRRWWCSVDVLVVRWWCVSDVLIMF